MDHKDELPLEMTAGLVESSLPVPVPDDCDSALLFPPAPVKLNAIAVGSRPGIASYLYHRCKFFFSAARVLR